MSLGRSSSFAAAATTAAAIVVVVVAVVVIKKLVENQFERHLLRTFRVGTRASCFRAQQQQQQFRYQFPFAGNRIRKHDLPGMA